jgi:hypothetical protein
MWEPGGSNTAGWAVLGQLEGAFASPPVAIETENSIGGGEAMAVRIGWLCSAGTPLPVVYTASGNGQSVCYGLAYKDTNPIQRGHYYNMDIAANFSKGTLIIIRDGVTIVNYSGPLGFSPFHWEYGFYRAPTTNDIQALNYRNMVVNVTP